MRCSFMGRGSRPLPGRDVSSANREVRVGGLRQRGRFGRERLKSADSMESQSGCSLPITHPRISTPSTVARKRTSELKISHSCAASFLPGLAAWWWNGPQPISQSSGRHGAESSGLNIEARSSHWLSNRRSGTLRRHQPAYLQEAEKVPIAGMLVRTSSGCSGAAPP